jgi:hypothetical protein
VNDHIATTEAPAPGDGTAVSDRLVSKPKLALVA